MKNTILIMALFLAACDPTAVGAGAKIAVIIGKAVAEARDAHPDDLQARIGVYAGMYCQLRDEEGVTWEKIRDAAKVAGAPDTIVDAVKVEIDKRCS